MGNVPENVRPAVELDPWLEPFAAVLSERRELADKWAGDIRGSLGAGREHTLAAFARDGYQQFGLHADARTKEIRYREWAPNAQRAFLVGDFNGWNTESHELTQRDQYGVFSTTIAPLASGDFAIPHDSRIKVLLVLRRDAIVPAARVDHAGDAARQGDRAAVRPQLRGAVLEPTHTVRVPPRTPTVQPRSGFTAHLRSAHWYFFT